MKKVFNGEYILTRAACDEITEGILDFLLNKTKCDRKEALRIQYSLDSILLGLLDLDEGIRVRLTVAKRLNGHEISLVYVTADELRFNPIESDNGEGYNSGIGDGYFDLIADSIGGIWNHEYENGVNTLSVVIKKRTLSETVKMILAVVLSVAAVVLMSLFVPAEVRGFILENFVDVFIDKYVTFLKAFVSFMVFVSISGGILKLGNPNKISTVGFSVIKRIIIVTCLIVGAAVVASPLVFDNIVFSSGGTVNGAGQLLGIVYDMIPSNLVSPFIDGNFIQILVVAVVFGLAMLCIRKKIPTAEKLFEDLNAILTKVIGGVGKLTFVFVFASVVHIGLSSSIGELVPFLRAYAFDAVLFAILILGEIVWISFKTKRSLGYVFKSLIRISVTGFTTCSGAACFAVIKETTDEKFGVRPSFSQFSVPMMLSLFKTGVACSFFVVSVACAEYSGVSVSITNLIVLGICAAILSHASPPVPGGTISCYPILFVQLGLPLELIAVVSAINPFFDMIETATSMLCVAGETVSAAKANKLISENGKKGS